MTEFAYYDHFMTYFRDWLSNAGDEERQALFNLIGYQSPMPDEARTNRALLQLWIVESTDEEVARALNMVVAMDNARARLRRQDVGEGTIDMDIEGLDETPPA